MTRPAWQVKIHRARLAAGGCTVSYSLEFTWRCGRRRAAVTDITINKGTQEANNNINNTTTPPTSTMTRLGVDSVLQHLLTYFIHRDEKLHRGESQVQAELDISHIDR